MQTNVATRSKVVTCARFIPFGFLFVVSALTLGQSNTGSVLPPPGTPQTVKNADGSTTTTTRSPVGGTQVVTKDSKGNVISTVNKASIVSGGQSITVDAGNVSVSQTTDSRGNITHLVKKDPATGTTTTLDYDANGELIKAIMVVTGADGREKSRQVYEAKGPNGTPERYNEATHSFERIDSNDWERIKKQVDATADEIKAIRDKFAQEPEKDELAAVREEAAKHPMELAHGSGPLPPPKDPFETRYEQQKELEKQLDPCLIGTWRSISNEVLLLNEKGGGEGIVITINEDHSITIDYSAMTPMSGGNAKNVWKGVASGYVWASQGRAGTTSVEKAEAYLITNGKRNPQGNYKDLGPAKITSYKCDDTTLTVESVTHRIVYQRQKEAK
jgi:YD repeat-containing protein